MTKRKNADLVWNAMSDVCNIEQASLQVLQDIRDELQGVRRHLSALEDLARCVNVQRGFIAMNKVRLMLERLSGKGKEPLKVRTIRA